MEVLAPHLAAAEVVDGVRWLLIAVFALAAIEKATSVWTRSAAWHPVLLLGAARRRHATPLMAAALAADLGALALLVAAPAVGGLVAALLTVLYGAAALPIYSRGRSGGCACFWKLLETRTRASFLARNALLAGAAVALAAKPPAELSAAGAAYGAAFLVALTAAVAVVDAVLGPDASRERARSARHFLSPRSGVRSTAAERR